MPCKFETVQGAQEVRADDITGRAFLPRTDARLSGCFYQQVEISRKICQIFVLTNITMGEMNPFLPEGVQIRLGAAAPEIVQYMHFAPNFFPAEESQSGSYKTGPACYQDAHVRDTSEQCFPQARAAIATDIPAFAGIGSFAEALRCFAGSPTFGDFQMTQTSYCYHDSEYHSLQYVSDEQAC